MSRKSRKGGPIRLRRVREAEHKQWLTVEDYRSPYRREYLGTWVLNGKPLITPDNEDVWIDAAIAHSKAGYL